VDWCWTGQVADTIRFIPGQLYIGGTGIPSPTRQGWLTAIDVDSGVVRWKYHSTQPRVGAVTVTAGRLVFSGELTGDFLALDDETGRELYRFNTGGPIGGGVVTYAVGGTQYVATTSGSASRLFASTGAPTVIVFALPR
jgi:alcohol dehydrogenase (cytochrome c)